MAASSSALSLNILEIPLLWLFIRMLTDLFIPSLYLDSFEESIVFRAFDIINLFA